MKSISKKITGLSVSTADCETETQSRTLEPVALPDEDPAIKRIDKRPEGALEAVSEKIVFSTAEGKQTVYIIASFMEVQGRLDGEPITVTRPIEFFYPTNQATSEHQWISATMRSLSLAARGGYCAQNLADLRKVVWDRGPVRLGINEYGKPMYHNSEVAALAYAIQQMLYRQGFLDRDGNAIDTRTLAQPRSSQADHAEPAPPINDQHEESRSTAGVIGSCPECGSGELRLRDGCPCCDTCFYSRC